MAPVLCHQVPKQVLVSETQISSGFFTMPLLHKPHQLFLHFRQLLLAVEVLRRLLVIQGFFRGKVEGGEHEGAHRHADLAPGTAVHLV